MLFQIFAKDWLLTVFIRALHRLEQAMLKVVLQQETTGQWDTWSRALGRGAGCKAWGGWGGRTLGQQEDKGGRLVGEGQLPAEATCCLCWGWGMQRAICGRLRKPAWSGGQGFEDGWRKQHAEFILDHLLTCSHSQVNPWTSSLALPINLPAQSRPFLLCALHAHPRHQVLISALCCCCLVAQSCPTLCDPVDCSLPGSSVHGDSPGNNTGVGSHSRQQYWSGQPGALPDPGIKPASRALAGVFFTAEPPGKPQVVKAETEGREGRREGHLLSKWRKGKDWRKEGQGEGAVPESVKQSSERNSGIRIPGPGEAWLSLVKSGDIHNQHIRKRWHGQCLVQCCSCYRLL